MTTQTQHTPGPWSIGPEYGNLKNEILAGGRAIAAVWTKKSDYTSGSQKETKPYAEGQANARLIAAAPKMFEMIKNFPMYAADTSALREAVADWSLDVQDIINAVQS